MIVDKRSGYQRWKFIIKGKTSEKFRRSIDNGRCKTCIKYSILLLEEIKIIFSEEKYEKDKRVVNRINRLIKKFNEVELDEDKINRLLDKIFDLCDEYGIFIDLF